MSYFKLAAIILFSMLMSCQNKKAESFEKESFNEFNKRFHSDSVFQISRVDFPIDGVGVSGFERHNWTKTNWKFLKIPVAETTTIENYQHSLVKTDTTITEKFWIENSGFEVERQFKLIDNKWFLIYYDNINL